MLALVVIATVYQLPFSAVYSIWSVWVAEGLSLGRAVYSQLWGLAAFVEVPAMLIAGYLGDRYGRRLPFMAGLSLFAVVYLLYIVVPMTAVPLVIGSRCAGDPWIRAGVLHRVRDDDGDRDPGAGGSWSCVRAVPVLAELRRDRRELLRRVRRPDLSGTGLSSHWRRGSSRSARRTFGSRSRGRRGRRPKCRANMQRKL